MINTMKITAIIGVLLCIAGVILSISFIIMVSLEGITIAFMISINIPVLIFVSIILINTVFGVKYRKGKEAGIICTLLAIISFYYTSGYFIYSIPMIIIFLGGIVWSLASYLTTSKPSKAWQHDFVS